MKIFKEYTGNSPMHIAVSCAENGYRASFTTADGRFSRSWSKISAGYDYGFDYDFTVNDTLTITGDFDTMTVNDDDIVLTIGKSVFWFKNARRYLYFTPHCLSVGCKNLIGTEHADTITKTVAGAVIPALGSGDSISNKGNRVSIDAGNGKDTIQNDGTNSTVVAGMGDDVINNTATNVTIEGGIDNDTIKNRAEFLQWLHDDLNDIVSSDGEKITIGGNRWRRHNFGK